MRVYIWVHALINKCLLVVYY